MSESEKLELATLINRLDELAAPSKDRSEIEEIELKIMLLLGDASVDVEKRTRLRLPCELKIKIHSKDQMHMATVVNIGQGGIFAKCSELFPVGEKVQVEVKGNNPASHLKLRGDVAWVQDGENAGIGISFGDITIAARAQRLRQFVRLLLGKEKTKL